MKKTPWRSYLTFALFCTAIYFPLFLHLDWEPVHEWDESLFAMRAGYMAEEGRYLQNYSHWVEYGSMHPSTKPPFTTWIQALSMKVFGVNELGLRLPIALCALATVFLLLFFSKRQLGDINIGYCAGFVLVTSAGYIREHAARTGDQDAALALYMLAGAFAFQQYVAASGRRERHRWLALLTFLFIISALTKYIFGLFFLPAFLVYAIYKKEWLNILKRGSTWIAALVFLTAVGSWLVVMEVRIPGFANRVFFYEMIDRYSTVIENHEAPWHYYFTQLWEGLFMPWLLLLPVSFAMIFLEKSGPLRDTLVLMFLCAFGLLSIVTFSQTKLPHYDVVAYPPMALLSGTALYRILQWIVKGFRNRRYLPVAIPAGLIVLIFLIIRPYASILERVYKPRLTAQDMKYGYLLKNMERRHPDYKSFKLLYDIFDGQAMFYAGQFNRKKGYDIRLSINPEQVKVGEIIATCDARSIGYLVEKFELRAIETYEECFLAEVVREK